MANRKTGMAGLGQDEKEKIYPVICEIIYRKNSMASQRCHGEELRVWISQGEFLGPAFQMIAFAQIWLLLLSCFLWADEP